MTLGLWEYFWDLWPTGTPEGPLVGDLLDTFYVGAEPLLIVPEEDRAFMVGAEHAFDPSPDLPFVVPRTFAFEES